MICMRVHKDPFHVTSIFLLIFKKYKIRFICNYQTLCRTTFKIVLPFQNPQCPRIRMKIRILFSSKMVMMTTVKKKTVFIDIVQKNNTSELSIQTFIPSIPSQLILLVFQFLFLTNHQSSFMKLPIGSNGLKTRARFFSDLGHFIQPCFKQ